MVRYQVILAYDGTRYQGFQRQADKLTVQGVFEAALRLLGWQDRTILAAGRTDTGVHASGQVIAFDLDWKHAPDDLQAALNAHLPADVSARAVTQAQPGFHPRYDALGRVYRYAVLCDPARDPLQEGFAWRVWPPLELHRLQSAANSLVGAWDFKPFGSPLRAKGNTRRSVLWATWQQAGAHFNFEIAANAFLYHMVRRLVYAQMLVGQGRLDPEALYLSLAGLPVAPIQGMAPACGLTLVEVLYPRPHQTGRHASLMNRENNREH